MAQYAFKCVTCHNKKVETRAFGENRAPVCRCGETMARDFRAELDSQMVHIPSHMRATNTSSRNDFLPTAKDYESPSDPSGEKGLKEFKDTHKIKGRNWV